MVAETSSQIWRPGRYTRLSPFVNGKLSKWSTLCMWAPKRISRFQYPGSPASQGSHHNKLCTSNMGRWRLGSKKGMFSSKNQRLLWLFAPNYELPHQFPLLHFLLHIPTHSPSATFSRGRHPTRPNSCTVSKAQNMKA